MLGGGWEGGRRQKGVIEGMGMRGVDTYIHIGRLSMCCALCDGRCETTKGDSDSWGLDCWTGTGNWLSHPNPSSVRRTVRRLSVDRRLRLCSAAADCSDSIRCVAVASFLLHVPLPSDVDHSGPLLLFLLIPVPSSLVLPRTQTQPRVRSSQWSSHLRLGLGPSAFGPSFPPQPTGPDSPPRRRRPQRRPQLPSPPLGVLRPSSSLLSG